MAIAEFKKNRLIFIYFCIIFAFLLIILRLFYLAASGDQVKVSGFYNPNRINKRGDIIDRSGTLVATDLKTKSLYVSSILIKDPQLIA